MPGPAGTNAYPDVLSIRLTTQQAAAVRLLAALDDRSPSAFARWLLAEGIARRTGTPPAILTASDRT